MTVTIPTWMLWMLAGYVAGRVLEAIGKFAYHMHRETQN